MNRAKLLRALQIAKPSLGADGGVIPVLSHFCFMGDALYAYNDIFATIVEENTGLSCALHGDTLLGLLSVIEDEEIDIHTFDTHAEIKSKTGIVKVPLLPDKEFLFSLPEEESKFSVPITPEAAKGLEMCLGSVGVDSLRPEFTGVTLQAESQSGIVFYSSDNLSASRYRLGKFIGRKGGAVVLPAAACEQILKLSTGAESPPKLSIGERAAIAELPGGVTLVTKVFTAKPEQFDTVFASHADKAVFILKPEGLFAEMQKAAIVLGKEQTKECLITFAKGKVGIVASGQLGSMQTSIPYSGSATGSVRVGPAQVTSILPLADKISVNHDRSLVFSGGDLTRIISSAPTTTEQSKTAPPKTKAPTEDVTEDVPY